VPCKTVRRNVDAEQRQEVVFHLRGEGHSLRAIAGVVGVSDMTVHRDLADAGATPVAPDRTTGKDGKSYPSSQPLSKRHHVKPQSVMESRP
jgi:transposase